MKAFRLALLCTGAALLLLPFSALHAQTRPTEEFPKEKAYIRRFSIGGKGGIHALPRLKSGDITNTVNDSSTLRTQGEATAGRFVYGVTVQAMLTEKFGVAADVLFRSESYENNGTLVTTVTDPFTFRTRTEIVRFTEQSEYDLWEIPLVVRYYNQGRRKEGVRTFIEGGVAVRRVRNINSSRSDVDVNGVETCCDTTPIPPSTENAPGAVIGAGLHATDDFGIAVVPQVRFTRWLSRTTDSRPTRSGVNTLEFQISVMF